MVVPNFIVPPCPSAGRPWRSVAHDGGRRTGNALPVRGPSVRAGGRGVRTAGDGRAQGGHMAADLFTYSGKRAVVVGGASGMGAATARLVRDLGGDVVVLDVKDPVEPVGRFGRLDLRDR